MVQAAPDGEFRPEKVAAAMGGPGRQFGNGDAGYASVAAGQVQGVDASLPRTGRAVCRFHFDTALSAPGLPSPMGFAEPGRLDAIHHGSAGPRVPACAGSRPQPGRAGSAWSRISRSRCSR